MNIPNVDVGSTAFVLLMVALALFAAAGCISFVLKIWEDWEATAPVRREIRRLEAIQARRKELRHQALSGGRHV